MSPPILKSLGRSFLRPALFFIFLAIPSLLVVEDVRRIPGLLWGFSVLFVCLFIYSLEGSTRFVRLCAAMLVGVFAFLNIGLALSFITQGTAFNTAFFSHLDLSTLSIALKTDGLRMAVAFLYVIAAPVCALWVIAHASWPGLMLKKMPILLKAGVLGIATCTSYPIISVAQHYITTSQSSDRLLAEITELRALPSSTVDLSGTSTKNWVILYLESVEANYLDPEIFPALTPNLNALASEGLWFRDIQQFPGTGWTIGGIVSSQCGVPLLSDRNGNMVLVEVDNPFSQITCMPEYLKGAGYNTAFLGGASLDFAGKGNFLRDNGYDITLGIEELPNATGHNWGMFDDDLFAHATVLFDGLAEGGEPFLLTTLTLDTHHPSGTPSPSCDLYQESSLTMLSAVHCADKMSADFVSYIRASPVGDKTVIVIMSDHLLIHGETKEDLLSKDRRILLLVLDPDRPAAQMTGSATHFDVAPTLLEALGFPDAQFAFGHSLLSHHLGRAFERNLSGADFETFKIERLTESSDN